MARNQRWQHAHAEPLVTISIERLAGGSSGLFTAYESNTAVGTVVLTVESDGSPSVITISGPHIRLRLPGLDAVYSGEAELTGAAVVLRNPSGPPRGLYEAGTTTVLELDVCPSSPFDHYDLDVEPGERWYYGLYYPIVGGEAVLAYDARSSFSDALALRNDVDDDGAPTSRSALWLYNNLPATMRQLDEGLETWRICLAVGKLFDTVVEQIEEHNETRMSPDRVRATLLPAIDYLLGWPTNFELPEFMRRRETASVASLWKTKGSRRALELFLELVTGYNATVETGWRRVLRTWDSRIDDIGAEPVDWEPEDGDWDELVGSIPYGETYREDGPTRYYERPCAVTPSTEDVGSMPVPWPGANSNGYFVRLEEVEGVSPPLSAIIVRKIRTFLPLLQPHFAATEVAVASKFSESLSVSLDDEVPEETLLDEYDEPAAVSLGVDVDTFTPDFCPLETFPSDSRLCSPYYRTPHADMEFTCGDPREPATEADLIPDIGFEAEF